MACQTVYFKEERKPTVGGAIICLLQKKLKNPSNGPKYTIEISIHLKFHCSSMLRLGCRGGGLGWGVTSSNMKKSVWSSSKSKNQIIRLYILRQYALIWRFFNSVVACKTGFHFKLISLENVTFRATISPNSHPWLLLQILFLSFDWNLEKRKNLYSSG